MLICQLHCLLYLSFSEETWGLTVSYDEDPKGNGAQERTWTSTPLRGPAPEAGVSTNFTTWAQQTVLLSLWNKPLKINQWIPSTAAAHYSNHLGFCQLT